MKDYTRVLRDSIVVALREAYPIALTTWQITCRMPWEKRQQSKPEDSSWRWWEGRDDMTLVEELPDTVVFVMRPFSSEVYNSLRALERKGLITRIPRDPGRRDRHWVYLPGDADLEICRLESWLELT